jgi:hypothetical protein
MKAGEVCLNSHVKCTGELYPMAEISCVFPAEAIEYLRFYPNLKGCVCLGWMQTHIRERCTTPGSKMKHV